nr:carotenoid oxygenase family protein [Sphingomonas sp. ID1715]
MIRSTVTKGVTALADFNRKRLPPVDDHPFLTGIHTPMTGEETITELAVTGTIPPALDGQYLRIGPNPIAPDARSHHWFTGDGMVHGVALQGGRALWYRNRWIRSKQVAALRGVEPAPGPRHGSFDTVNTNVVGIAGRIWALVEAGSYPVELGAGLDEQAYNPFDGTLTGSFTAHPHFDPLTGENHAICYESTDPGRVRHVVVSAEGKVVRDEPIPVQHGPSIHDCAITARYVLVFDLPVTFSMKKLIAGHSFPYAWNPDHPARVGLMPRQGTADDIIWCDVDPCYVFHPCNAYDLPEGRVVVDVVAHESMFDRSTQGPDSIASSFERWTIDPAAHRVERRVVDASPQEFPRPDERRFGQTYRYAYTMALPEGRADQFLGSTKLYKHDLESGTRQVHDFGEGRYPGEFVFVPAHPEAGEDEGWLIGLVVNYPGETTDLVILDAQDFEGEPRASVRVPHRVPPGFHGNWIASA